MELAMVGLGKMGGNMASRLLRGGHQVVAYNRSLEPVRAAEAEGAVGATSLEDVVLRLSPPRVVWLIRSRQEISITHRRAGDRGRRAPSGRTAQCE